VTLPTEPNSQDDRRCSNYSHDDDQGPADRNYSSVRMLPYRDVSCPESHSENRRSPLTDCHRSPERLTWTGVLKPDAWCR
jgi:hypothetical protein